MKVEPAQKIEPWPWMLATMLVLMIASSLTLWSIAAANPDGLVAEDAWQAGLQYNARVAAEQAARDLGLSLEVTTRETGEGLHVETRLPNRTAESPLHGVYVERVRPAEAGFDQRFELTRQGSAWTGDVPIPLPGRWKLIVTADLEAGPLRHETLYWHRQGAD